MTSEEAYVAEQAAFIPTVVSGATWDSMTGAQFSAPHTDYPVRVRPRQWDEDGPGAPFYAGIYDVVLNTMVTVSVVPDLGTTEFDPAALSDDPSTVRTHEQARLEALLFAQYAVVPSPRLAGTTARAVGGPDQVRARIDQDRAYVHAVRDADAPSDPRISASATYGKGVHERQLQHLAQRTERDGTPGWQRSPQHRRSPRG